MHIKDRVAEPSASYYHAVRRIFNFSAMGLFCLLATCVSSAQSSTKAAGTRNSGASATGSAGGQTYMGVISDTPIYPGETVHVLVSDATDFSVVAEVSEKGEIAIPMAGAVHLAGLNSEKAQQAVAERLVALDLVMNPRVTVTVENEAMGITVLGEVHAPGIYELSGKHLLSDLLATAGGMTTNAGRVIEISNVRTPDKAAALAWDPTMHNTANYNREIHAGDRILVRPCGIAYVGGNVGRPGAYSLCGSPVMTLSELVAMAGGVQRLSSPSHTYLIRTRPDGSRIATQINVTQIQKGKAADVPVQEDDIIYVSPSALKMVANQAVAWAGSALNRVEYVGIN